MRSLFIWLSCILCLVNGDATASDLVVVVNPNSGIEKLSLDDTVNIFMGRYRRLSSGITAEPIDLAKPVSDKEKFYAIIVGKDLIEIDSYRARLKFSGKRSPPLQADGDAAVIEFISKNIGGIGYIDKTKVDKRVKIVLDLSR